MTQVKDHFNKTFNGQKNYFTQTVLDYGVVREGLEWELSVGEIMGTTYWGVSVIKLDSYGDWNSDHEKSEAFNTEQEARAYTNEL